MVVDEIDKKSYATSDTIRRRARGVFALLEQTLTEQRQGEATAGGVRIEVLLDEPQHVRLPKTTTRDRGPGLRAPAGHRTCFRSRS
ncbi:hypothetical protein Shyd_67570 [Streptomyces hydrogenans]|uniref:Uncharacterized protein n=1 Tax=Streptomyces hydrogenans TaxID=1873719 RepID=A0ABQ3PK46_9ACTN|nr:hypothetical protein [Streptomyces hydrogenans]GHI25386.1 hypothetical protein Shyd_67570 [Streptomyces hydrogenans]